MKIVKINYDLFRRAPPMSNLVPTFCCVNIETALRLIRGNRKL